MSWLIASAFVGGALLLHHLVSLPITTTADTVLRDRLRALMTDRGWSVVHVMYRECGCSRRTIEHLLAGPRPLDLHELVVMVDDLGRPAEIDATLRAAGFGIVVVTPSALRESYHLEAAPVLIVLSPDRELVYVGGYNRHKQSSAYEDTAIIAALRDARRVASLPVFGCATSARLARAIDPLGLGRKL